MKLYAIIILVLATSCSYQINKRKSSDNPASECGSKTKCSPAKDEPKSTNKSIAAPKRTSTDTVYLNSHLLELTNSVPNSKIYYTLDGTTPTKNSTVYTEPILITTTTIVKAVIIDEEGNSSDIITIPIEISDTLPSPTASPAAGVYSSVQNVSLTSAAVSGVTIYYTTDGAPPTTASNVYSGPIELKETTTLKWFSIKAGWNDSEIKTAQFTFNVDLVEPVAGSVEATSNILDTSLTLNWDVGSDSSTGTNDLEYMVCRATSAAAVDSVADCLAAILVMPFTANTLTYNVTGLLPNTTYYFNILVRDAGGNVTEYGYFSETTGTDSTAPTPGTFSANTNVTATSFTLNWTRASDNAYPAASLEYLLCSATAANLIDDVAKCTTQVIENYTEDMISFEVTGKQPGTNYYYNVVVRDPAGNTSVYEGKQATTAADTTAPVAGTFQAATDITVTSVRLNWTAASDNVTAAADLEYFVCSDATAAAIDSSAGCLGANVIMAYNENVTTYNVTGLSPGTEYHFNVVVRDAAGQTSIYPGYTVTTAADNTAPVVGSYSATTGISSDGFTLNWSAASDNATIAANLEYYVCTALTSAAIDTIGECEAAPVMALNYTANKLNLAVTGKDPDTTYYFNVLVKDSSGNVSMYGVTSATTDAASLGGPDSDFGASGLVTPTVGSFGDNSSGRAVLVQPDDKIVQAGTYYNGMSYESSYSFVRLNANGTMDNTFGSNGIALHFADPDINRIITDMAIQGDGKIVAVGMHGPERNPVVMRLNTNGTLDTTFNSPTGANFLFIPGLFSSTATTIKIDTNGKILIAGQADQGTGDNSSFIIRLNADGTTDNSFGSSGIVILPVIGTTNQDTVSSIAVLNDGKILLAGTTTGVVSSFDPFLARFNANGSIDTTFGTSGVLITTDIVTQCKTADMLVESDGKIVIGATCSDNSFMISRFNADGSADTGFNSGGIRVVSMAPDTPSYVTALNRQSNGKYILSGYVTNSSTGDYNFAAVRINADGTLDTTYNSGGKITTDGGREEVGLAAKLDSSNKLIIAGTYYSVFYYLVIRRYNP